MIRKKGFIAILTLLVSQPVLGDGLEISHDEILGEWKLLAIQLQEEGPIIEDDGTSTIVFSENGSIVENMGFGSLEREYFISDGKLFVKTPIGEAEWEVTAKSGSNITLKTSTGILHLEKTD